MAGRDIGSVDKMANVETGSWLASRRSERGSLGREELLRLGTGRLPCGPHTGWAFTLIELLVVIAIISILLSMVMPSLRQAREAALSTRCRSNLRSMAFAFFEHVRDHDDRFVLNSSAWTWSTYGGYLQMRNYVTQTRNWPHDRGEVATIATCPTQIRVAGSWDQISSTYRLNSRIGWTGDQTTVTGWGVPTLHHVQKPALMLMFSDGWTSGEGGYGPDGNLSFYGRHIYSVWLLGNSSAVRGVPMPFSHADAASMVFMDGHVEMRTANEHITVHENPDTRREFERGR